MISKIRIDGIEKTVTMLGKAKNKDAGNIADALKKISEMILAKSQIYVPVEFGDLKKSGRVEGSGQGFGAKYTVAYGGPSAPYAMFVHEIPENQHAPPTCYKYLERAARELRGSIIALIKRTMEGRKVVETPTVLTSSSGAT